MVRFSVYCFTLAPPKPPKPIHSMNKDTHRHNANAASCPYCIEMTEPFAQALNLEHQGAINTWRVHLGDLAHMDDPTLRVWLEWLEKTSNGDMRQKLSEYDVSVSLVRILHHHADSKSQLLSHSAVVLASSVLEKLVFGSNNNRNRGSDVLLSFIRPLSDCWTDLLYILESCSCHQVLVRVIRLISMMMNIKSIREVRKRGESKSEISGCMDMWCSVADIVLRNRDQDRECDCINNNESLYDQLRESASELLLTECVVSNSSVVVPVLLSTANQAQIPIGAMWKSLLEGEVRSSYPESNEFINATRALCMLLKRPVSWGWVVPEESPPSHSDSGASSSSGKSRITHEEESNGSMLIINEVIKSGLVEYVFSRIENMIEDPAPLKFIIMQGKSRSPDELSRIASIRRKSIQWMLNFCAIVTRCSNLSVFDVRSAGYGEKFLRILEVLNPDSWEGKQFENEGSDWFWHSNPHSQSANVKYGHLCPSAFVSCMSMLPISPTKTKTQFFGLVSTSSSSSSSSTSATKIEAHSSSEAIEVFRVSTMQKLLDDGMQSMRLASSASASLATSKVEHVGGALWAFAAILRLSRSSVKESPWDYGVTFKRAKSSCYQCADILKMSLAEYKVPPPRMTSGLVSSTSTKNKDDDLTNRMARVHLDPWEGWTVRLGLALGILGVVVYRFWL